MQRRDPSLFFSFKYLLRNASKTAMHAHCSYGSLHGKINLKINQVWRAIIHLAFERSIQAHFPPSNVFYLRPSRLLFLRDKLVLGKDGRSPLKKVRQSCSPTMQRSQWLHLLHSLISLYCQVRAVTLGGELVALSHPQVLLFPPFQQLAGWQTPYKGECIGSMEGSAVRGKTVWELRSLIFHFQGLPHRRR